MTYKIADTCMGCNTCLPYCPTGAISVKNGQYSIDSKLCDNCADFAYEPQCVVECPISSPVPLRAKKGRIRNTVPVLTSAELFPNGKTHAYASSIVIWEACNLLSQRQSLSWQQDEETETLVYQRRFNRNCELTLQFSNQDDSASVALRGAKILSSLHRLDIRAACLHLIYAAHATTLERPWEQEFVLNDRQIEAYLGLDKRKDLSKSAKLTLIKEIAQQPCLLTLDLFAPAQGRIHAFSAEHSRLWHLNKIQHHFQEDDEGCKHLVGLTFRIQPGVWTKYFLNRDGCRDRTAFYQYGVLPVSLLQSVMTLWQQHEGAARMMLWLLFKVRIGKEQRLMVPTLMRVAYGEARVQQAALYREERKRLLRSFENDLEAMSNYGLKPRFDPDTYPLEIQPLWARVADLPDDAEAALEFWTQDANQDHRLTDNAPRDKWNRLMQSRLLGFELPPEWEQPIASHKQKRRSSVKKSGRAIAPTSAGLTGEQIVTARKNQGISQHELAARTGKSQSWVRDIESGRFHVKSKDQELLCQALGLF